MAQWPLRIYPPPRKDLSFTEWELAAEDGHRQGRGANGSGGAQRRHFWSPKAMSIASLLHGGSGPAVGKVASGH